MNPEDMPKLELEYTGETKDLTIPAGLKIYDSIGKEIKMSDLKRGQRADGDAKRGRLYRVHHHYGVDNGTFFGD